MSERVGGIIQVKVDSKLYKAKGSFSFDLGGVTRTGLVGHDGVHGYTEMPKVAYIEGTFTDSSTISNKELAGFTNVTVTLNLANGKTIMLRNAWFADDLEGSSEEGELSVKFESEDGEEI